MAMTLKVAKLKQFLRDEGQDTVDLNQIIHLAEVLTESMKDLFEACDAEIYKDLSAIADQISDTKQDLACFRAVEMQQNHIPGAGVELDAVVEATESATETIMEAAEAIMSADPEDHDGYVATVNDKIIEIFEACSFQDITGQRISKVVKTLSNIDSQINNILAHFDADGELEEKVVITHRDQEEKDGLLNGPALKGQAVDQSDIDNLFS